MRNEIKTSSVMLQTLCVPCGCRCRYCLLSWDGRRLGADYARSEALAKRFYEWISRERPALSFNFSFGYSMEHPQLFRALDFMNSIGSVGGRFLQLDGMALREGRELAALLGGMREHGVEALNLTFYGMEAYHDGFAGRRGDFAYLLNTLRMARELGFEVSTGVPLTRESASQADELVRLLRRYTEVVRLFIPHGEGRGAALEPIRFVREDIGLLSGETVKLLNRELYRTEAEWLAATPPPEKNRALLISLTPENIGRLEQTPFADIIREVERLDEEYYTALPPFAELAAMYGDENGSGFFRLRDLQLKYQRRYIKERGLRLHDVTDERLCGSRRY
ncbi:MAG: hypothetical protein IJU78_00470 [Clostridia bacterium]|nr:hypothetical protein [Clostridia bacterium]